MSDPFNSPKSFTPEQIAEYRAEKDNGTVSAVGEYTPDEFWWALDEIERLQAAAARYRDAAISALVAKWQTRQYGQHAGYLGAAETVDTVLGALQK